MSSPIGQSFFLVPIRKLSAFSVLPCRSLASQLSHNFLCQSHPHRNWLAAFIAAFLNLVSLGLGERLKM